MEVTKKKPSPSRIALAVIALLIIAVGIAWPVADMLFGPFSLPVVDMLFGPFSPGD